MQPFLPVFLMIFNLGFVFAQGPIELSGQVKDADSKENVPFCKVLAIDPNDSIVRGGITDDKGFFALPVPPGNYRIVASTYGYESDTLATGFVREDAFVGVLRIKSSVQDLEDVKVEASSRMDLLDRDVQIVTEDQKMGSTAAKDVLSKMPGISYDEYSGRLKVDNDANILVLVNGVEKSQEYVQNLEPERLLRVETVRDPGGRYGLEGYSAIVNVILKDDYKGTELYLEEMQLVDINERKSRLDVMIMSLNATYNYTHNKLNLYGGLQMARRRFQIFSSADYAYDDGTRLIQESGTDPNGIINESDAYYTLGFDYKFNPKHQLSFESHIAALPKTTNNNTFTYLSSLYSGDSLIESYSFIDKLKSKSADYYNSIFYIAEFDERNKLNVNFAHSYYESDYVRQTLQEAVYDRSENGTDRKQYTRFYAEYDHKFGKNTTLQLGYGNTWRELKNDYDIQQFNLLTSDTIQGASQFTLNDLRHKLYTNFSWKINNKWGLMVGIAGESSSPRALGKQFHYFIYQPMLDLKYTAGKAANFRLKYRVSSAYPSIEETNPFVSQVNPILRSTGNPFLKPSTTHELSLRMNFFGGLISLEPYSHFSNGLVVKVGELDTNGVFNFRFENTKLYQLNGVEVNFNKFFKFSMLLQGNLNFYQARIVSSVSDHSLMDWTANIDLIYIFKKTETLLGIKYQRERVKSINGLGYSRGEVDFWMLFYKQPLFKKRASILFGYFLPINFGVGFNQDTRQEAPGFTVQQDNDISLVKNMFVLEFSYRFTKGNSVRRLEKKLQKEEEKSGGGMF